MTATNPEQLRAPLMQPDDAPDAFDVEYRVKVLIRHDLQNGLRAGDEFEPCAPSRDRSMLVPTAEWWNGEGHHAVIQVRTARTSYDSWREDA